MQKQKLLRYCGILLIVLPFLGLYGYMKNFAYILIGITLLLNSRNLAQQAKDIPKKTIRSTAPRTTFPKIAVEHTDTISK
jgi:NADH:ubiquinone oxidoreductase subunit K